MDVWDRQTRRFAIIMFSGWLLIAILGLLLAHATE
jgi:hypothetical protein